MGLSSVIRDLTGIIDLEKKVSDLEDRLNQLEKEKADRETVERHSEVLRELQPISIELTDRERQILDVFIREEKYLTVSMIAEETGLSRSNAGAHMSNLKQKVEFDIKTMKNNRKEYRLPEETKKEIFQGKH